MTSTPGAAPARPRVVIGVDDSPGARAALHWGLGEAVRRGAHVQVVASFPVDYHWAAPEMAAAFLLVVGSRGRGAVRSLLMGSVSLHCAGHAHSPLVVVPAGTATGAPVARRRVVVGIDGSPASAAALLATLAAAARSDAEVDVVAAYDDGFAWVSSAVAPPTADELRRTAEAGAERMLTEVRAAAVDLDLPEVPVQLHVVAGRPGDVLVARGAGASLLVVGSHGAGQLRGLVLGSVALHCALQAPCPVLLQREGDRPGVGRPPRAHLAARVPA